MIYLPELSWVTSSFPSENYQKISSPFWQRTVETTITVSWNWNWEGYPWYLNLQTENASGNFVDSDNLTWYFGTISTINISGISWSYNGDDAEWTLTWDGSVLQLWKDGLPAKDVNNLYISHQKSDIDDNVIVNNLFTNWTGWATRGVFSALNHYWQLPYDGTISEAREYPLKRDISIAQYNNETQFIELNYISEGGGKLKINGETMDLHDNIWNYRGSFTSSNVIDITTTWRDYSYRKLLTNGKIVATQSYIDTIDYKTNFSWVYEWERISDGSILNSDSWSFDLSNDVISISSPWGTASFTHDEHDSILGFTWDGVRAIIRNDNDYKIWETSPTYTQSLWYSNSSLLKNWVWWDKALSDNEWNDIVQDFHSNRNNFLSNRNIKNKAADKESIWKELNSQLKENFSFNNSELGLLEGITFSRNTRASYVIDEQIYWVEPNYPRQFQQRVLLENSSENRVLWSHDLSKWSGSVTQTSDGLDGSGWIVTTATSDKTSAKDKDNYVYSIWAKGDEITWGHPNSYQTNQLTNRWTRYTQNIYGFTFSQMYITNSGTSDLLVFGPQIEIGYEATSYIISTQSTGWRDADIWEWPDYKAGSWLWQDVKQWGYFNVTQSSMGHQRNNDMTQDGYTFSIWFNDTYTKANNDFIASVTGSWTFEGYFKANNGDIITIGDDTIEYSNNQLLLNSIYIMDWITDWKKIELTNQYGLLIKSATISYYHNNSVTGDLSISQNWHSIRWNNKLDDTYKQRAYLSYTWSGQGQETLNKRKEVSTYWDEGDYITKEFNWVSLKDNNVKAIALGDSYEWDRNIILSDDITDTNLWRITGGSMSVVSDWDYNDQILYFDGNTYGIYTFSTNVGILSTFSQNLTWDSDISSYCEVNVWVYPQGNSEKIIVGSNDDGGDYLSVIDLYYINGTGFVGVSSAGLTLTSNSSINNNEWTHLRLQIDFNLKEASLYINGVFDVSQSWATNLNVINFNKIGSYDGISNMYEGWLFDLRLNNRFLTDNEYKSLLRGELTGTEVIHIIGEGKWPNGQYIQGIKRPGLSYKYTMDSYGSGLYRTVSTPIVNFSNRYRRWSGNIDLTEENSRTLQRFWGNDLSYNITPDVKLYTFSTVNMWGKANKPLELKVPFAIFNNDEANITIAQQVNTTRLYSSELYELYNDNVNMVTWVRRNDKATIFINGKRIGTVQSPLIDNEFSFNRLGGDQFSEEHLFIVSAQAWNYALTFSEVTSMYDSGPFHLSEFDNVELSFRQKNLEYLDQVGNMDFRDGNISYTHYYTASLTNLIEEAQEISENVWGTYDEEAQKTWELGLFEGHLYEYSYSGISSGTMSYFINNNNPNDVIDLNSTYTNEFIGDINIYDYDLNLSNDSNFFKLYFEDNTNGYVGNISISDQTIEPTSQYLFITQSSVTTPSTYALRIQSYEPKDVSLEWYGLGGNNIVGKTGGLYELEYRSNIDFNTFIGGYTLSQTLSPDWVRVSDTWVNKTSEKPRMGAYLRPGEWIEIRDFKVWLERNNDNSLTLSNNDASKLIMGKGLPVNGVMTWYSWSNITQHQLYLLASSYSGSWSDYDSIATHFNNYFKKDWDGQKWTNILVNEDYLESYISTFAFDWLIININIPLRYREWTWVGDVKRSTGLLWSNFANDTGIDLYLNNGYLRVYVGDSYNTVNGNGYITYNFTQSQLDENWNQIIVRKSGNENINIEYFINGITQSGVSINDTFLDGSLGEYPKYILGKGLYATHSTSLLKDVSWYHSLENPNNLSDNYIWTSRLNKYDPIEYNGITYSVVGFPHLGFIETTEYDYNSVNNIANTNVSSWIKSGFNISSDLGGGVYRITETSTSNIALFTWLGVPVGQKVFTGIIDVKREWSYTNKNIAFSIYRFVSVTSDGFVQVDLETGEIVNDVIVNELSTFNVSLTDDGWWRLRYSSFADNLSQDATGFTMFTINLISDAPVIYTTASFLIRNVYLAEEPLLEAALTFSENIFVGGITGSEISSNEFISAGWGKSWDLSQEYNWETKPNETQEYTLKNSVLDLNGQQEVSISGDLDNYYTFRTYQNEAWSLYFTQSNINYIKYSTYSNIEIDSTYFNRTFNNLDYNDWNDWYINIDQSYRYFTFSNQRSDIGVDLYLNDTRVISTTQSLTYGGNSALKFNGDETSYVALESDIYYSNNDITTLECLITRYVDSGICAVWSNNTTNDNYTIGFNNDNWYWRQGTSSDIINYPTGLDISSLEPFIYKVTITCESGDDTIADSILFEIIDLDGNILSTRTDTNVTLNAARKITTIGGGYDTNTTNIYQECNADFAWFKLYQNNILQNYWVYTRNSLFLQDIVGLNHAELVLSTYANLDLNQATQTVFNPLENGYREYKNLIVNTYNVFSEYPTGAPSVSGYSFNLINTNGHADPFGGNNAELVIPDSTLSTHGLQKGVRAAINDAYVYSVYVKSAGYDYIMLREGSRTNAQMHFDLSNGTLYDSVVAASATGGIESLDNDWYRVWMYLDFSGYSNGDYGVRFFIYASFSRVEYSGDEVSGVYTYGMQLELANGSQTPTELQIHDFTTTDTGGTIYERGKILTPLNSDNTLDILGNPVTNSIEDLQLNNKLIKWEGSKWTNWSSGEGHLDINGRANLIPQYPMKEGRGNRIVSKNGDIINLTNNLWVEINDGTKNNNVELGAIAYWDWYDTRFGESYGMGDNIYLPDEFTWFAEIQYTSDNNFITWTSENDDTISWGSNGLNVTTLTFSATYISIERSGGIITYYQDGVDRLSAPFNGNRIKYQRWGNSGVIIKSPALYNGNVTSDLIQSRYVSPLYKWEWNVGQWYNIYSHGELYTIHSQLYYNWNRNFNRRKLIGYTGEYSELARWLPPFD